MSMVTKDEQKAALEMIGKQVRHLHSLAKETEQDPGLVVLLAMLIDTCREALDHLDADEIDQPAPGESKH